ncbi:MAG: transposase [Deltaproteobacteria bacterium]|nr:transposase [Deltaproteobacteria bacterium]
MARHRTFTNEFKAQVVREYLASRMSRAAVARRYEIAPEQIKAWQKRHEQGTLTDEVTDTGALHQRIAELERMVGWLALENDLLKNPQPGQPGSQTGVLPRSSAGRSRPGRMGVRSDRTFPEQLLLSTGRVEEASGRGCGHPGPDRGAGVGVSSVWISPDDRATQARRLPGEPQAHLADHARVGPALQGQATTRQDDRQRARLAGVSEPVS